MTRLTMLVLSAVVALGATVGVAFGAYNNPTKPAKVGVRSTKLGKVLVNGNGVTLYLFEKDTNGKSACSGACATAWPPVLTKGGPHATAGAKSAKLGTTRRADGTTQVTYGGHPLYTFIMDHKKPGSVAGEGVKAFGAEWYVLARRRQEDREARQLKACHRRFRGARWGSGPAYARRGSRGHANARAARRPSAPSSTLAAMPSTPVAIVTDSTHYLPRELVASRGIHVVSLYVSQGGVTAKESDMAGFEAFYEGLRTAAELPTTSQPSIGDFLEVYEPLAAAGRDIVSVHLSGGVSGTVESARQAAAELRTRCRIEVVDSLSTAGGLAMVVLAAQAAADGGAGVELVAGRAREAVEQMKIWFCVDTLEYFRRGGRIGRAQAWIGGALSVKPILSFSEGILEPIERVRTRRRAVERMLGHLRERQADGATAWVVQHIESPDDAAKLVAGGREIFGTEPLFVTEVGPVLGTYAGPGMLGVGGIPPSLVR